MHHTSPPYCHNDLKPGNVLLGRRRGETLAVIMDFGSTAPAAREIRNRTQALTLQVGGWGLGAGECGNGAGTEVVTDSECREEGATWAQLCGGVEGWMSWDQKRRR